MKILTASIHTESSLSGKRSTPDLKNEQVLEFLEGLISTILSNDNQREYSFASGTSEVSLQIQELVTATQSSVSESSYGHEIAIGNRYFRIENTTREAYEDILKHEIPHGVLVQALVEIDGQLLYVISKADYIEFFEQEVFSNKQGLPKKKALFKGFHCLINGDYSAGAAYVCDSTGRHSSYWWKVFLELVEVRSDSLNTQKFWSALERSVLNKIKKYPTDYETIRNGMILYMRNNSRFEIENFIESTLSDYQPYDRSLDVPFLINNVRSLPGKYKKTNFDSSFGIDRSSIRARVTKKYTVNPGIQLIINEGIEDFDTVIQSVKDDDGTKYIKIRSNEETYNKFLRRS